MQMNQELFKAYIEDTTTLIEEMDLILKKRNSIGTLDRESVDALFRIFHTIKASAAVLEDNKTVDTAYKMENIVGYIRKHGASSLPMDQVFSLMFEAEYFFRSEMGSLSSAGQNVEFQGKLNSFVSDLDFGEIPDVMMVSFESLRPLFEHVIAEMSAELGKKANLYFDGEHIYVDRQILTRLSGPLTQIVRNAMDHGIETPEERIALGKPPEGAITVTYGLEENIMFITIFNDGKTLSLKEILRKADHLHILKKPRDAYKAPEIANLIMERGFTTKEVPTKYSGRGVGMDIIKSTAEDLGGTVLVNAGETAGFSMTLAFPIDDKSQRAAIRKKIETQGDEEDVK